MTGAGARGSPAEDWEDLYQNAPCGYLTTSPDGSITSVNDTLLNWTGHKRDALVGKVRFADILSPGDRIFYETHYGPLLRMQGSVREIAFTIRCPDGRRLPVLVNATLREAGLPRSGLPRSGEEIRVAVFVAEDRRQYERELLAARQRAEESDARARLLAQTLQASLLPPEPPAIPGLELAAVYRPAGRGDEVGGDFYDIIEAGQGDWTVILGDVCGKGAAAAAITSLVRHTTRAVALRARRPRTLLRAVNQAVLSERRRGSVMCFSTLACARLETRQGGVRVTVGLAGHPYPYLLRGSSATPIGRRGTVLGFVADPWLEDAALQLAPGDTVVLFTDGVTEARRGGEFYGEQRLEALLGSLAGRDADGVAAGISDAVLSFQGGDASDDIAIVVIRVPA